MVSDISICPNCGREEMRKGLAPFIYHGMYLGEFDAYICDFCRKTYFTENAYKKIMEISLDPKDYSEFSDEVKMPISKSLSISPYIITTS